jgi:phospholipid/cholesterol/gamma-HCH transport system substrate-binding protein
MNKTSNYIWKLGMFVIIGITLFLATIYFVGATRNLFGSTLHLKSNFTNVSGLKVGNIVRFSGINVGTIKSISFVSDTVVVVDFIIKDEIQKFIKTDAVTSIGTDGLMGDKVLTISPGTPTNPMVKENDFIASSKAIEMEDIMKSLKTSMDYAGIITQQLAEFSYKMNSNKGALSKLMTDEKFANSIAKTLTNLESSSDEFSTFSKKMNNKNGVLSKLVGDEELGKSVDTTITNLKTTTESLNETIKAAQNNFLLKGYFNKKKRAEEKLKKAEEKKLKKEEKLKNQLEKLKK